MGAESPNVILYDVNGQEMSVSNGAAIPAGTSALMIAGSDGTNSRFITLDGSGRTVSVGAGVAGTPAGGVMTIQGVASGTVIPISITGTNTISGTVTANAGTGNFTVVQATASNLRAQTSAESTTGSAPPTNAELIGGSVTTAAPSYTTGQMSALSLDTSGNLRVTGTFTSSGAADVTASGALGALNAAVTVTHPGLQSVGFQLAAGTFIGTIIPEVSYDGGTTWNATYFDTLVGNIVSNFVFGSSNTATAAAIITSGGAGQTRVRISAYTSGTANATVRASDINDPSVLNSGVTGATLPPVVQQIGGSVTTAAPTYITGTLNALSLTTAGAIRVDGSGITQPVSGTVTSNQGTANTLANAWSEKLTDGTNGPVAVKAASTAAVAADSALVVAVSPNNIVATTISDVTATGTLGALNANVQITTAGLQSIGMQLAAGTLIGTIIPQISFDGGTTWNAGYFFNPTTDVVSTSIIFGSSNTATPLHILGVGGSGITRVLVSAYTSGTANITLRSSSVIPNTQLAKKATYSAISNISSTSTSYFFSIAASATKTIKLKRFELTATRTTSGFATLLMARLSTINSGSPNISTLVAHNTNDPASTASVLGWTATPTTLGNLIGDVRAATVFVPATSIVSYIAPIVWTFGDRSDGEELTLLPGTTQSFAWSWFGGALAGGSYALSLEWTEE